VGQSVSWWPPRCSQAFISAAAWERTLMTPGAARRHLFRWLAWPRQCSASPGELEPPLARTALGWRVVATRLRSGGDDTFDGRVASM
jgi:hypothetical protein